MESAVRLLLHTQRSNVPPSQRLLALLLDHALANGAFQAAVSRLCMERLVFKTTLCSWRKALAAEGQAGLREWNTPFDPCCTPSGKLHQQATASLGMPCDKVPFRAAVSQTLRLWRQGAACKCTAQVHMVIRFAHASFRMLFFPIALGQYSIPPCANDIHTMQKFLKTGDLIRS